MKELRFTKEITVRFSEVDSMGVVWHGSYPLYFEDAREAFGRHYGLGYETFLHNDVYAPIVELSFRYHHIIRYSQRIKITIIYKYTISAKIIFEYEIRDAEDDTLLTTGRTTQVFMDKQYEMIWYNPKFYEEWKAKWLPQE